MIIKKQALTVLLTTLMAVAGYTQAGQVGTTTGSFQVTASGQSAYSMAIEVPPGIMGVVPQVSISYSSAGGNGLFGLGANLNGLSSITRCGSSLVQDNIARPVQYNQNDFFCLNGQRLILISGSYGASGSVYQTEIESYQKVTAHGQVADGPQYFSVLGKGGSQLVFGKETLHRSIDPITGAVSSWSISYLQDKHGNRVDYEYQDASEIINNQAALQILPKRIHYGRNDSANVDGELAVEFVYEDRPDVSTGYARGQQFISNKRITNIKTRVGDEVVKDYQVTYEQSPVSQRSRIKKITECAGEGDCLLPVTFDWHNYNADWQAGDRLPTAALTAQGRMRGASVDVNNDGHVDWVTAVKNQTGQVTLVTYLNNSGQWQASNQYQPPAVMFDYQLHNQGVNVSELVDMNGDGRVDWVQAYQNSSGTINRIWLNTGSGWQLDSNQTLPHLLADLSNPQNPKQLAQFTDLNGDALPDLIASYKTSNGTVVNKTWLNSQQGWQLSTNYQLPTVAIDYAQYDKGAVVALLLDINSDGLVDVVQSYKSSDGNTHKQVWLNVGDGWQATPSYHLPIVLADYSTPNPESLANPIDLNGDGLLDMVQAHQQADGTQLTNVWLNTGNGWRHNDALTPPAIGWMAVGDTIQNIGLFADLTDDGLPDLIRSFRQNDGSAVNKVWRNLGNGWQQDSSLDLPVTLVQLNSHTDSHARGFLIDANSDGRGDLLMSQGGSSSSIYLSGIDEGDYALPDVVVGFSDGLANDYHVEYTPATQGNVYTPDTDGSYPNVDVSGAFLLVSAVESSVGTNESSRAEHQYFGKKANLLGRGDLGFAKKIVTDKRTHVSLETEFSQHWPFIGSLTSMHKTQPNGVLLSKTVNSYQSKRLFSGKTWFVYQDHKTSTNYEINGDLIGSSSNQTLLIDDYGNIQQTKTIKTRGSNVYTHTQTSTYHNDLANWQLGRVETSKTVVSAPNTADIETNKAFTYFANGDLKSKIIEPTHEQAVTEQYTYDAFGHIATTTISSPSLEPRVTTATYTDDGRFAATATNPLGHIAKSEYHPFFGQPTRTEGPNGQVTEKLYDDHGRMIKTTKIRSDADQENATDDGKNVIVFHPCGTDNNCPPNAAYFLGVVDNEGESPETVYYDNRNREVRKQTQGFDGTSVYIDTQYDNFGRKHKVSKPYFKDQTQLWTTYQYDLLGRVIKVTSPAGYQMTTAYATDHTISTNPLGQTKTTWVNGQGKPIKVLDTLGNKLEYQYDAAGKLLKTIDQAGNEITVEYDHFGRKTKQVDPDLGAWQYRYDAFGQLIWQRDAKLQVVTMQYDKLGRVIQRNEAEGVTQWEYDTADNGLGKLAGVYNDQGYERSHQYDEFGRPTFVTTSIDGDSTTIETAYIATTERVDYVKYPSGLIVRKTYNEYGFPLEIRSSSLEYYQRYLDQVDLAQQFADDAQQKFDDTREEREGYFDTYETQKELGEDRENNVEVLRASYNAKLHDHNKVTRKQQDYMRRAQSFQRLGNKHQKIAQAWQYKALYHSVVADILVLLVQKRIPPQLGHRNDDIENMIEGLLGVPLYSINFAHGVGGIKDRIGNSAPIKLSDTNVVKTAEHVANLAGVYADNVEDNIQKATDAYEQMNGLIKTANYYGKKANSYYEKTLKPIADQLDSQVEQANHHYGLAKEAADQINRIDTAVKRVVDKATNAKLQADVLYDYYADTKSDLHWQAQSADAEGKVTKFTQGKHVTTTVDYDTTTGRLKGVYATSDAEASETENSDTLPAVIKRLQGFISQLDDKQVAANDNMVDAQQQMDKTQAMIAALNPSDPLLSDPERLATQAQLKTLQVNLQIHQTDRTVNQTISNVVDQTRHSAQVLNDQFDQVDASTQNVLLLSSKVHRLIADYNQSLRNAYQQAADAQAVYIDQLDQLQTVPVDYLAEFTELGQYHATISQQHAARAESIQINDGSEGQVDALQYGLQRASHRHKKLISRHADASQKRQRLNVALFNPLHQLTAAAQQKYSANADSSLNNQALADHFAQGKLSGKSNRVRFALLEIAYRDRLHVLEQDQAQDSSQNNDLLANDAQRKQFYQYLADVNQDMAEMYTNMGQQDYWDSMADSHVLALGSKQNIYRRLAENHHHIANNNELLATTSSDEFDHGLLGFDGVVLDDTYDWDALGNLTSRTHGASNVVETFQYDQLNRLTQSSMSGEGVELYNLVGQETTTYQYDALGNLSYKSDVGSYQYGQPSSGHAGPHAVTRISGNSSLGQKNTHYQYDDNGNMTAGDSRSLVYTSFNKPIQITKNGKQTDLSYGPERQLIKEVKTTDTGLKTTYHFGGSYEKISEGFGITHKYHLSTHNGATIAVIVDTEASDPDQARAAPTTHYLHRDHLDSIVAITNERGFIIERFHYDAFGKQLTAVGADLGVASNLINIKVTNRGFTGHKMLNGVDLIHMKGRVYDPSIGRFLSADPHIQFAGNLQSYNRYSYVLNNPLAFNDPSGYFLSKLFKALKKLFKKIVKILKKIHETIYKIHKKIKNFVKKYWRVIVTIAVAIIAPYAAAAIMNGVALSAVTATMATSLGLGGSMLAGAIAGGVSGLVTTGSLTGALKGAALGALSAGITNGIGSAFKGVKAGGLLKHASGKLSKIGHLAKNLAHSAANGVMNKLQGGSFSKAFASSFVSTGAKSLELSDGALQAGLVGGISSEIAGGSFARGFTQSFATEAYNDAQHGDSTILGGVKDGFKKLWGGVKGFFAADEVRTGWLASFRIGRVIGAEVDFGSVSSNNVIDSGWTERGNIITATEGRTHASVELLGQEISATNTTIDNGRTWDYGGLKYSNNLSQMFDRSTGTLTLDVSIGIGLVYKNTFEVPIPFFKK